jgi:hypothetical protein
MFGDRDGFPVTPGPRAIFTGSSSTPIPAAESLGGIS